MQADRQRTGGPVIGPLTLTLCIIETSPHILSETEYRTFWIDAKNGLIRVGKGPIIGENITVTYTYSGDNILNPNYVGFRTGWQSGGANWNVCTQ